MNKRVENQLKQCLLGDFQADFEGQKNPREKNGKTGKRMEKNDGDGIEWEN